MKDDKNLRDDLHKEFQVERMILFSDAVFAIVITLMAIEIHIPETTPIQTQEELMHALLHLVPAILAYIVSFILLLLSDIFDNNKLSLAFEFTQWLKDS